MLSAEDIVNKQFKTKRDGYDPDDVDDFLDEVVKELRRIQIENDGLNQKILASESRVAELQRSGGSLAASPIVGTAETGTSSQLLQLARKLHDQHIQEGYTERDLCAIAAVKARQWKGNEKMEPYIRPKTLFNATNAANYRAELPANKIEAEQ